MVQDQDDENTQGQGLFDQECLDRLVSLGFSEEDAVHFLGQFLAKKTCISWTLIQLGPNNAPKFFVPTQVLEPDPGEEKN